MGREQGAHVAPRVSLAGLQFRAAGSVEYTDWVDGLLGFRATAPPASMWRTSSPRATGKLLFEIVSDPLALEDALRPRVAVGETARLVAAYGRPWLTAPSRKRAPTRPHDLPAHQKDFDITFERGGQQHRWSRIWNHIVLNDYAFFVQALPGSRMAEARNGHQGPEYGELLRRTQQAYRILLTRAMKGIYVWFEDDETRNYVRGLLLDPPGEAGEVPQAG